MTARADSNTPRRSRLRGAFPFAALTAALAFGIAGSAAAASRPANDDFAQAQALATSGAIDGTTAGATIEPGEPGVSSGGQTVWFDWTAPAPGEAFVVPAGSGAAVRVRIYTGTALAKLVRVDQADAGGAHVLTELNALPGVTYRIQVQATPGKPGAFDLSLVQPALGQPANDQFAAALPLTQAVRATVKQHGRAAALTGTTAGATGEKGEPGSPAHSVWYSWRAPAGTKGKLIVSIRDTTGSSKLLLSAFSGTELSTLRRVSSTGGEHVSFGVSPGTTYDLQVSGAEAYFALSLTAARGFRLDTTPPTVVCKAPRGWVDTNAAVHCTASDSGSGLAQRSQASFTLHASVAADSASASAATNSEAVCDKAGNCTTAGPVANVKVDLAAPVVQCGLPPSGWSAQASVQCQASDPLGGSGLAHPADRSFSLTAALPAGRSSTAAAFAAVAPVCDAAGNCTRVPLPKPVRVDHSPPVVHCGAPPQGWVLKTITISCTASDADAGLAVADNAQFTLTTNVGAGAFAKAAYTTVHEVCDKVGNCTKAGPIGPIKIDREPPVVSCQSPPQWKRATSETVRCRARSHVGLANAGEASFLLAASISPHTQAAVRTDSRRICDVAGSCMTAGPLTVGLDDAPPKITCTAVPRGWQPQATTVSCSATDAGSGVAPRARLVRLRATVPPGSLTRSLQLPAHRICDGVGNCSATPRIVHEFVDRQAPLVTCAKPSPGRHAGNVEIACTASDGHGSGLASAADESFDLSTAVLPGETERSANSSTKQICDEVGNCTTAGPLRGIDVDLRQSGGSTPLAPQTIEVLAAEPASEQAPTAPGAGAIAVPYDEIQGGGLIGAACSPVSGAPFPLGKSRVVCSVPNGARGTRTDVISLVVSGAGDLAPSGAAVRGERWRAVGRGFAAGSTVTIAIDQQPVAQTRATAHGTVSAIVPIAADETLGQHVFVLSGTTATKQPLLVITRLTVHSGSAGTQLSGGAPAATGPTTPVTLLGQSTSGRLAAPNGTVTFGGGR